MANFTALELKDELDELEPEEGSRPVKLIVYVGDTAHETDDFVIDSSNPDFYILRGSRQASTTDSPASTEPGF